jgi:hypothetical protein
MILRLLDIDGGQVYVTSRTGSSGWSKMYKRCLSCYHPPIRRRHLTIKTKDVHRGNDVSVGLNAIDTEKVASP